MTLRIFSLIRLINLIFYLGALTINTAIALTKHFFDEPKTPLFDVLQASLRERVITDEIKIRKS